MEIAQARIPSIPFLLALATSANIESVMRLLHRQRASSFFIALQ